jgi:hypothetical protein
MKKETRMDLEALIAQWQARPELYGWRPDRSSHQQCDTNVCG